MMMVMMMMMKFVVSLTFKAKDVWRSGTEVDE